MKKLTLSELKTKEINAISIETKAERSNRPYENESEEKLLITSSSLHYDGKIFMCDKDNYCSDFRIFWNVGGPTPHTKSLFEKLCKAVMDILTKKQDPEVVYCNCEGLYFSISFEDGLEFDKDLFIPREEFNEVISIIKEMIPSKAPMPDLCKPYVEREEVEVPF